MNNLLYLFAASNDGLSTQLWSYDGTTLTRVTSINTGTPGLYPYGSVAVTDGIAYFCGTGSNFDSELWSFDGTTASLTAEINPGDSSWGNKFTVYKGKVYFSADEGVVDYQLWSYDIATTTATRVIRLNSSPDGYSMVVYHDKLYFVGDNGANGPELWVYDGEAPPTLYQDYFPGSVGSNPQYFYIFNDKLFMNLKIPFKGNNLYYFLDELP